MNENDISYAVRGAAFKVNSTLGPGLLESVYHAALAYELTKAGFQIRTEVGVPVIYDEQDLGLGFRLDIIVNEAVIVEIKSVEAFAPVHYKQLLTYLRLSEKKAWPYDQFQFGVVNEFYQKNRKWHVKYRTQIPADFADKIRS